MGGSGLVMRGYGWFWVVMSGYELVTGGYRVFLGLLGSGSGWFCAGYKCFWGGCELVFSGYQWLRVVRGCFWVVIQCHD